jgi:hypothetical protein
MQILAGLFLSKFDADGLRALGFHTFKEAFNAFGFGFGGRPASIKNYRDEFDPMFPNRRQGWINRTRRDYCMKIEEQYRDLKLAEFTALITSCLGSDYSEPDNETSESNDSPLTGFAKRLITGKAAEHYFQSLHTSIDDFSNLDIEDTTDHGCGYDFRLWPKNGTEFSAVEVKGLSDTSGSLQLTDKEFHSASVLENRYYLFVVKNFRERPFHEIYPNPLAGPLKFARKERVVIQVSWSAVA